MVGKGKFVCFIMLQVVHKFIRDSDIKRFLHIPKMTVNLIRFVLKTRRWIII